MSIRQRADLSIESIKSVLEMGRASRICKVLFSGGEPLTRLDFLDILHAARGLETSFVTNGILLSDELLLELNNISDLRRIRISIDGFSAHDAIRKGSSYIHILDRIAATRQICHRLSVTPHSTASPLSIPQIPSLLTELQRLKVDRWRLFMIRLGGAATAGIVKINSGYIRDYVALLADIADRVARGELTMQIEADGGYQSNRDDLFNKYVYQQYQNITHPCEYLVHVLTIRNNGDISICPFFEFGLGNIRSYASIAAIEENRKLVAWRNHRVENISDCKKCRYKRICRSGCRKNAVELRGSFLAEDPLYCFMFPLLERMLWPKLSLRSQRHFKMLLDEGAEIPLWRPDDIDELLQEYYSRNE